MLELRPQLGRDRLPERARRCGLPGRDGRHPGSPTRPPGDPAGTAARPPAAGRHAARRRRRSGATRSIDLRRRGGVVVCRPRDGALGEDAGLEDAPMTKPTPRAIAGRELVVEHLLVEQRVRHRDEECVDVSASRKRGIRPRSLIPAPTAPITGRSIAAPRAPASRMRPGRGSAHRSSARRSTGGRGRGSRRCRSG